MTAVAQVSSEQRAAETCGIYVLRNLVNGKTYVGQSVHVARRFKQHKNAARRGDKSHLYKAMRHYGAGAFICEVVEECEPTGLDEREAFWMAELDSQNPAFGYNFMPAGQRGRVMDAAMRARLSAISSGYKHTPEALEKMRAASTGRKHSADTKERISQAHAGKVVSKESTQRLAESLKRRWIAMSEQEKADYAAARSGWTHSEQFKRRMSECHKGKPKSAQQRANMSAAAKARNPEAEARRLEAVRLVTKARWEKYRAEKKAAA